MVKNIDLLGNKVKTGDVLIELGRGGGRDGMYDHLHYQAIIEALSKDPNCFEKEEAGGKK